MKRQILISIFMCISCHIFCQSTETKLTTKYDQVNDQIKISYEAPTTRKVNISLGRKNGKVVIQKKVKAQSFDLALIVGELQTGTYSLLVEDGNTISSEVLELRPYRDLLRENVSFDFSDKKILAIELTPAISTNVNVYIFDKNNELLGYSTINPRKNPKATYDFSNTSSPLVRIEIQHDDRMLMEEKISVGENIASSY